MNEIIVIKSCVYIIQQDIKYYNKKTFYNTLCNNNNDNSKKKNEIKNTCNINAPAQQHYHRFKRLRFFTPLAITVYGPHHSRNAHNIR